MKSAGSLNAGNVFDLRAMMYAVKNNRKKFI